MPRPRFGQVVAGPRREACRAEHGQDFHLVVVAPEDARNVDLRKLFQGGHDHLGRRLDRGSALEAAERCHDRGSLGEGGLLRTKRSAQSVRGVPGGHGEVRQCDKDEQRDANERAVLEQRSDGFAHGRERLGEIAAQQGKETADDRDPDQGDGAPCAPTRHEQDDGQDRQERRDVGAARDEDRAGQPEEIDAQGEHHRHRRRAPDLGEERGDYDHEPEARGQRRRAEQGRFTGDGPKRRLGTGHEERGGNESRQMAVDVVGDGTFGPTPVGFGVHDRFGCLGHGGAGENVIHAVDRRWRPVPSNTAR